MEYKKIKDYHIIRIKFGSDDRKKKEDDFIRQQRWDRARYYNSFFWNFFERVVGINMQDYHLKYMYSSKDCAKEELFENIDIMNMNI